MTTKRKETKNKLKKSTIPNIYSQYSTQKEPKYIF